MDGISFLPYLEDKSYKSEDRYRFFHLGRWPLNPENVGEAEIEEHWVGTAKSSNPENYKYKNYAIRNERYRFVNDSELYDLYNDPGELENIAVEHPEVVKQMKVAYDQWWNEVSPLMVNEIVPLREGRPYWEEFEKQKESTGIPTLSASQKVE